jgi:hypothetical protein
MKNEIKKPLFKPSTRDILISLKHGIAYAKLLIGRSKPYDSFLEKMISSNFLLTDENLPSVKHISQQFNFQYPVVAKWIKTIYEDIFILNNEEANLFYKNEELPFNLIFKYFDQYCYFTTSLRLLPRIGDAFEFFFIKAKVGTYRFYVTDIEHQLNENRHEISVYLNGSIYNPYFELLKKRALFEGTISFMDYIKTSEYELENRLRKIYK